MATDMSKEAMRLASTYESDPKRRQDWERNVRAELRRLVAEQPAQQEPVGCEGAVVNGRVYADRLEHDYKFECEAGPLHLCADWVEFRRCFEWLAQHTSPPAQRKPLTNKEFEVLHHKAKGYVHTGLMDVVRIVEHHHGIKENT